jgi:hypothetical protein
MNKKTLRIGASVSTPSISLRKRRRNAAILSWSGWSLGRFLTEPVKSGARR